MSPTATRSEEVFVHPTALVATEEIGPGTRIWAFCNLLRGARIGSDCQLCDRVFVEDGVTIGNGVTVKCGVSIYSGTVLEDGVFIGPDVVFTNDRSPRSRRPVEGGYPPLTIRRYASIGGGAVLLPGITIGEFALVGAGAVVTKDVRPFELVMGNPARHRGWVCVCAQKLTSPNCSSCGRSFELQDDRPIRLLRGDENPVSAVFLRERI